MEATRSAWRAGLKKVVLSRWTFVGLQVLDLVTTLLAFRAGGVEVNPLVAHLTVAFGRIRGVLISKVIAVAIAMGVKKLIWVVNLFYTVIICWNILNLLIFPSR